MILLTGATGYIGSHTWIELLLAGYQVIGIDNLVNSNDAVLSRVELITKRKVKFIKCDLRDDTLLRDIFSNYKIRAVIHFAALKAVGESTNMPLQYYTNNVAGLLSLLHIMDEFKCRNLIFSSSATIYHHKNELPFKESSSLGATNPYGWTKFISEQILCDIQKSNSAWKIIALRYFNPAGAHHSGLIGEDPASIPNNLMPYISQVAIGKLKKLFVYGDDWPTSDGTGVRDYVHVVDLARGHLKALNFLESFKKSLVANLGTGKGYSVLEVIRAFEAASGKKINYQVVDRRPGDLAECYADTTLAKETLNWSATYDLTEMCVDSWRWQLQNPNGYNQ
jgi:UDP-glucose 4-epimerase